MYPGDKPLYPQAPQAMYSPPGMPPGIPQSFPGKDFPVPQGQLGMPFPAASMEPMGQPPPPFKEQPVPEAQVYDEPEMQAKPGLFTNERGNLRVRMLDKAPRLPPKPLSLPWVALNPALRAIAVCGRSEQVPVLLPAPGLRHLYWDDHRPRVSCSPRRPASRLQPRAPRALSPAEACPALRCASLAPLPR